MPRHVQVEALFMFAIASLKVYQISHELAMLLGCTNELSRIWLKTAQSSPDGPF